MLEEHRWGKADVGLQFRNSKWLLSDNEISISLLVALERFFLLFLYDSGAVYTLILSGRILNDRVQKKTIWGALIALFPMKKLESSHF